MRPQMFIFLKGLAIGFAIAAPVGPIGLLCIRRSMVDGRLAGFFTGLGAATADALYGLVAVLGVTAITTLLLAHATAIHFIGGFFLLYLGFNLLRTKLASPEAGPAHAPSLRAAYFSTVALTLANPVTILAFVGIFSGLGIGLGSQDRLWSAALLVLGVFLGSCAWWLFLSSGASWLSSRINTRSLRIINLAAGGLIVAFGLWQLGSLILHYRTIG